MITNISKNGIDLIKKFEGLRLKAYKCPAGVWTIGYGHTKGVKPGDVITEKEAYSLLQEDLGRFIDHVRKMDEKYKYNFNQNEFDALVSFAFNIGSINGITNNGKRTKFQISCKIKSYIHANGKVVQGLINRRNAEYNLYMKPVAASTNDYEVGKTYTVTCSSLNVRKAPSVDADKALKTGFKKGKTVTVSGVVYDKDDNTWLKVSSGKNYYYICAVYKGKVYVK